MYTKVKHIVAALAQRGMESRVFIRDSLGRKCDVMIRSGTHLGGIELDVVVKLPKGRKK